MPSQRSTDRLIAAPLRLGPEWQLTCHEAGRLILEKNRGVDARRAVRLAVTMMGSLVAAVALALATPPGLEIATWPVAVLLGVVALLAATSTFRSARLASHGQRLEVTPAAATGTLVQRGLWHGLFNLWATVEVNLVESVEVQRVAHTGLTLSLLEVRLKDGRALAGPEVAWAPGSADPLEPVAAAMAAIIGRNLVQKAVA